MAERAEKLRKLQHLTADVPYVSKSALEGILGWVKKNGDLPLMSSKTMKEANRTTLQNANAYGPLLVQQDVVMVDGSKKSLPFLNLHSFLHAAYKAGGALFTFLGQCVWPYIQMRYAQETHSQHSLAERAG